MNLTRLAKSLTRNAPVIDPKEFGEAVKEIIDDCFTWGGPNGNERKFDTQKLVNSVDALVREVQYEAARKETFGV